MASSGLIETSADQAVLDAVNIVAPVDSAVLVQGETGTGKEEIARASMKGIGVPTRTTSGFNLQKRIRKGLT